MSTSPEPPLLRLPTEVLLLIAANLRHHEALPFALVNKPLAELILEFLYRFNIAHENSSILYWAVTLGTDALVRKLLENYHPNVNAVHEGETPLIAASRLPHRSIFSRLMRRRDVHVDFANAEGRTALPYAACFGHTRYIEPLLVRKVGVNLRDRYGNTPLAIAAENGRRDVVSCLLRVPGIDVNDTSRCGYTPLAIAVEKGHRDVVSCLLRVPGIDVNATTRRGLSPLALAVTGRRADIATQLLRHPQIDVHRGRLTKTPLELAIKVKPNPVLGILVSHSKMDINIDIRGRSAFLAALQENDQEAAWLLWQKGCQIDVPHDGGSTALELAIEHRMERIARVIIEHSPRWQLTYDRLWPPLCHAVYVGSAEIVQLLIASGVDLNEKDWEGRSPLYHAVDRNDGRIVELLLSEPAIDVNTANHWGLTPLHVAASNGLLCMV